jgi:hypothetical protein
MSYGSLDQLKARLTRDGVSPLPADEDLQGYLNDADDVIDGYCRRDLGDHPGATVEAEGKGMRTLLLPVSPLRSVAAVDVDGVALAADELADLEVLSYGVIRGYFFPRGSVVTLICDWGYQEPPAKVAKAAVILASRLIRHGKTREKLAQGLRSQSVEGVSFSADPLEIDRDVAQLLAPYVRKRAAR